MSRIALILAGHGSHISANTAGVVWTCVDRLRQLGIADEITACFWKEPPAFSQVLNSVEANEVVIVPVFTARGFFTQQVLPSEMGLSGPVTQIGERRITLTPPIGEHDQLAAIVDRRLRQTMERFNLPPRDTAIAVIGHGTRRNRASRDTARDQAERLRQAGFADEVVAVYLDDDPDIASVYKSTRSPTLIALPYFVADGSHVGIDVPRALGIIGSGQPERVDGRTVFYCDPVGADDAISEVVLTLARATGLPFAPKSVDSPWAGFPTAGRATLLNALETGRIQHFGQLRVDARRVWHSGNTGFYRALTSPTDLRGIVRDNPFRPLPTSQDLPSGWRVDLEKPEDAHAVIETVYPGLVSDWAAAQSGLLSTESLKTVSKRQVGMFKGIHELSSAIIQKTIERVCGKCIRQPSWWQDLIPAQDALPCRSACNLWLSTARKLGDA